MTDRYKASPTLEAFVLNQAPRHHPACDAPNSWTALKAWGYDAKPGDSMPVYDGGSDKTIYTHARYNYAFRAWHDKIHLDSGLGFNKLAEVMVSNIHVRQARRAMIMFNLTEEDFKALRYDVAGQVLYYYRYNEYVNDQAAFVQACFDNGGLFNVINSGVKY